MKKILLYDIDMILLSLLNCVPYVLTFLHALRDYVPCVFSCSRALMPCVLMCSRVYVHCVLTC